MNVPLPQPDVVEPVVPQSPDHDPGTLQITKKWWIVGGIILVAATVAVAALYSDYLGSKVAPGRKFKVLGPSTIKAGQSATIVWDTSTEIARQYPYEKIEYCYGKTLKRKCVVLAAAAPNNGKAVVKVPASVPAGKGYLKFTARDPQKKLFGSLVHNSSTVRAQPASTASSSGGSSGGGGGSSGGGNGGGGGGDSRNSEGSNELTSQFLPIVLTSWHENVSGSQFLIEYYSASSQSYGFRYRQSGEEQWRSGSATIQGHRVLGTIDIGSQVQPGAPIELFFFAENSDPEHPQKTYRVETCPENHFCRANFTPPNALSVSSNVTVSNFRGEVRGGGVDVKFTTNQLVFLSQMHVQVRLATTTSWETLGWELTSENSSFYRQDKEHTVYLPPATIIDRLGASYEVRVTTHDGTPLGETFQFAAPGSSDAQLRFEQWNPSLQAIPAEVAIANGTLIRWETNLPATTEITTKASGSNEIGPAVSFTAPIVSHVIPIVTSAQFGLEYDVKSYSAETNTTLTYHGHASTLRSFCSTTDIGIPRSALPSGSQCLARAGIGPGEGLDESAVPQNMPWAIYCNGQPTQAGRQCFVCQFPQGNFAAAQCSPAPGDPAQW